MIGPFSTETFIDAPVGAKEACAIPSSKDSPGNGCRHVDIRRKGAGFRNLDHAPLNLRSHDRLLTTKWQKGFSLMELMIVVALVATLAAIAIPNITRTLELQRLDSASSLIASKLAEARMNAIKRNRQAWVMIDPINRRIQVQTTNDAGAVIAVNVAESLPTGVSFSAPTVASEIRFDSMGRLPAGTAAWTVTLQGSNTRKSIGISGLGRVTVTDMVTYTE